MALKLWPCILICCSILFFSADLHLNGHPLILCTDDTGLFSTTLSGEYYLAAVTFGLDRKDVLRLATNAAEFVFAGSEVKQDLRQIFQAYERKFAKCL